MNPVEALLTGLQHSIPDLVLLDLKLPGLSGLETLKYVRQLAPVALVILLTTFGTMQDVVKTMKLGAYDFMIKSVDLPVPGRGDCAGTGSFKAPPTARRQNVRSLCVGVR